MSKNPFSIYDFMGYLFPGMMCYIIIAYCFRMGLDMGEITSMDNLRNLVKGSGNYRYSLYFRAYRVLYVIGNDRAICTEGVWISVGVSVEEGAR